MSNGQADEAPDAADDLIQFLADNPEADAPVAGAEEEDESDDPSTEDKSEEEEESPDDEVKASEAAKDQTSDLKFKVPVKGDDGVESTVEVDQKELIAGYQRHQDYTRKTMALADQERQVTEAMSAKLAQSHRDTAEKLQFAQAAIQQLVGLRTPQELFELSRVDPSLGTQEQARQTYISQVLSQLQGATQQEKDQLAHQQAESINAQRSKAWDVLSKEGIDKPKLKGIFETMISKYGETPERLSQLYDPTLVKIMRDAAAYQELLTKKATVAKKVAEAPKLPAQRQSVPKSEQVQRDINGRFRGGRAKLNDLAAYLANS